MAAAGLTHAQVAAKLVVEGCLGQAAGNVQASSVMPMKPTKLTELERNDIGLPQNPNANTLFYEVLPDGVFLDLDGATATVFFNGNNADRAVDTLDAALKRVYPNARQASDEGNPKDKDGRVRVYHVDFGNARLASVSVYYPAKSARAPRFMVQVVAQQRKQ